MLTQPKQTTSPFLTFTGSVKYKPGFTGTIALCSSEKEDLGLA